VVGGPGRARLGLKLEQQKGLLDVYVIDHAEKPTNNECYLASADPAGADPRYARVSICCCLSSESQVCGRSRPQQ
jgi:hypothetical protein